MTTKLQGPFKAHVRFGRQPKYPAGRVVTCERKTLSAAENFLTAYEHNVEAKWITSPAGMVYTPWAKGEPGEVA
jgi:hypothetical protein